MASTTYQGLTLVSAAAGSVLALFGVLYAQRAWRRSGAHLDLALLVTASVWLLHLVVTTPLQLGGEPALASYAAQISFQALMLAVSWFLLCAVGLQHGKLLAVLALQGLAGLIALQWQHVWGADPVIGGNSGYTAWVGINLASALGLTLVLARQTFRQRNLPCWLALAGSLLAIAICIDDVFLMASPNRIATLSHHFYAAFLLLMWCLLTAQQSGQHTAFSNSSEFPPISDFGIGADAASIAVADERRRIAQDLHDGVGSQIVNILSTLDAAAPQHRSMTLALESCLLDLKMTVDAIDTSDDSVVDALGQLRFRVQHSLDKLEIRMDWRVEVCGVLDTLRGERARQILRIAQEGLTNVMRHADATTVEVICRFEPKQGSMMLEISDDGRGIPDICASGLYGRNGKGLAGMRRRAQAIGGDLLISSQARAGTRVLLTVPMNACNCVLV